MPLEYALVALIVSILTGGFGIIVGSSTIRRNNRLDDAQNSAQITRIAVKLENIENVIDVISQDMRQVRDYVREEFKGHHDRLVRVEESAKAAHKRIDEIAARRNTHIQ